MDDRAALSAWRLWMRVSHALCGGVTPCDETRAGPGLVRFAESSEGAIARWQEGGAACVVWLGDGARVVAGDVPSALAAFVACGATPFEDVAFRAARPAPEEGAVAWLASTLHRAPPSDVPAALAAAAARFPNFRARGA